MCFWIMKFSQFTSTMHFVHSVIVFCAENNIWYIDSELSISLYLIIKRLLVHDNNDNC